ncbi:MAG: hypothetical protein LBT89_05555, partial [Planctomycetaceae bacterium]|nr:hypothetical protein [Planctomycetaceae bacterium]
IPVSDDTAAVKVQQIGESLDGRTFYECFEADGRFGIDEPERAVALCRSKITCSNIRYKTLEKYFSTRQLILKSVKLKLAMTKFLFLRFRSSVR